MRGATRNMKHFEKLPCRHFEFNKKITEHYSCCNKSCVVTKEYDNIENKIFDYIEKQMQL